MTAPTWCPCGWHHIDPRHGDTCPVCQDRAAKAAAAVVAVMWGHIAGGAA